MKDNLIKIYEDMYGSKNTIQQVEQAINASLYEPVNIMQEYSAAMDKKQCLTNKPAKLVSAKDHLPDEVEPAIELSNELSPAVDSSDSKEKNTKTITDKEKKKMAGHKFSFDELYKIALREQMEPGDEMPGAAGLPGDGLGDDMDLGDEDTDEVTLTISRDVAQTLCDILQAALGGDEGLEGDDELGGDELGEDDLGGDETDEDLDEATDLQKAATAKAGQGDKGNQKVMDPTTANKDLNFTKANINPNANVKVNKPKELNYETTK